MKLDKTDISILKAMQKDGRLSNRSWQRRFLYLPLPVGGVCVRWRMLVSSATMLQWLIVSR